MATAIVGTELVLSKVAEILGPDGEYEKQRIALRGEYSQIAAASKKVTEITSVEQAEEATQFGRLLQAASKETENFFKGVKVQVDAIKKPILAAEKEDLKVYEDEKTRLGGLQTTWNQKLRREQEEADRKAREDAKKQAEEDALQRAIDIAESGDIEGSEAALNEPIVAMASVPISRAPTRPSGSVVTFHYKADVIDLMTLVKAVAEKRAPLAALQANEAWINATARNDKDAFNIPGCAMKKTESTSYRS